MSRGAEPEEKNKMGYTIIKNIKIDEKEGRVIINATCNDEYPRYYKEEEMTGLSDMLKKEGKDAVDVCILSLYEQYEWQRGSSKYMRALKILKHMEEYKKLSGENKYRGENKEYKKILLKALKSRLPKDKYTVSKKITEETTEYVYKKTSRHILGTYTKTKAKIFKYRDEAEKTLNCLQNNEGWEIKKIA